MTSFVISVKAAEILSIISEAMALQRGYLCFADAPEGVCTVCRGKTMPAEIDRPLSLNGIGS
jgi:hypothetical protein